MAKSPKVIITCAVTGSIHTPSMSPHLPITAQQIADEAVAAGQRRIATALERLDRLVESLSKAPSP